MPNPMRHENEGKYRAGRGEDICDHALSRRPPRASCQVRVMLEKKLMIKKPRVRAVRRDGNRFARGRRIFVGVFPWDDMGKASRLLIAGQEWDGKLGSHLVDGTGWECTISWRDGTGSRNGSETGREIGRKHTRENGPEQSGKWSGTWSRT